MGGFTHGSARRCQRRRAGGQSSAVRRIGGGRKLQRSLAIATLVAGAGCGSGGATGGHSDGGGLAGCLPACLADFLARCPAPAGACTSESVSMGGTSSCYANGIQVESYFAAGAGTQVGTKYGACYDVTPMATTVDNRPRLQSIDYFDGIMTSFCITMDPADPNNRKGTVRCGVDCSSATGSTDPGQPFDFDNPACSFFRFEPCGPGCSWTDGVVYDDPAQICAEGAAGSCPPL
jgi:hypothetical protein